MPAQPAMNKYALLLKQRLMEKMVKSMMQKHNISCKHISLQCFASIIFAVCNRQQLRKVGNIQSY